MSKSALIKALIILPIFLIGLMLPPIFNVKANPFFPKGSVAQDPTPPLIEVQSPTEGQRLKPSNDLWLKFMVTVPKTSWGSIGTTFGSITSVSYILDSKQEQDLNLTKAEYGVISYSLNLGQLSGGKHTIKIIAEGSGYYGTATHDLYAGSKPSFIEVMNTKLLESSVQIGFWVEGSSNFDNYPLESPTLKINLISPSNTTYNQNTILLNFSIQKQPEDNFDYTIGYTMQGENTQRQGTFFMGTPITNEMTFHKNFTEIPDGTYTLTASAKYVDRIMWVYADKQTVTFTIDTKIPTPSPTPTVTPTPQDPSMILSYPTTIILATAIVLVSFGIFVYLVKKRTNRK